jgi:calcium-dependent protein kinase
MGACKSQSINPEKSVLKKQKTIEKFSVPGSKGRSHRGSVYALNNENIHQAYIIEETLGTGYFGTVKLGIPKSDTKKKYAVKSIDKSKLSSTKVNQLTREIETLTSVDHPNIIKYYETYNDPQYFHIVMEYCTGGELLERILNKKTFSELESAELIFKISSAISHCHSQGIVHRDLKPENILFESKADFSDLKIIDFGLSRKIDGTLNSVVGSPYYNVCFVIRRSSFS